MTTPPDAQDKPPREFWLCKGDPIDPLQCPDLHVYAKKPLWKFADDAIRVIEYSAYEAMREERDTARANQNLFDDANIRLTIENLALRTRIEAFRSFFNKYCICKTAEPYAVCLPCKMLEEDAALEKKGDGG